jgi:hypothetical protein
MRFPFVYLPEIANLPFASITGSAEIGDGPAGPRIQRPYWTISAVYIDRIGGGAALLPPKHWMHDALMLWLYTDQMMAINNAWLDHRKERNPFKSLVRS